MGGEASGEMEGVDLINRQSAGSLGEQGGILAIPAGYGLESDSVFSLSAKGLDDELGDIGLADSGVRSCDKKIHSATGRWQEAERSSPEGTAECVLSLPPHGVFLLRDFSKPSSQGDTQAELEAIVRAAVNGYFFAREEMPSARHDFIENFPAAI